MHRCPVPEPRGSPILGLGMARLTPPGVVCLVRDPDLGNKRDGGGSYVCRTAGLRGREFRA